MSMNTFDWIVLGVAAFAFAALLAVHAVVAAVITALLMIGVVVLDTHPDLHFRL
ncbi:hypothetical protein [Lacticaseibacillus parakribbianus]|uniref:hypothetical protein n=1 Tax=Lacticaseibacillus parakribbianus TaxID=2970927 RepID=UPI0021CB1228|nr:hypothetical protein [Lacticaseibacillus parakribbianus]